MDDKGTTNTMKFLDRREKETMKLIAIAENIKKTFESELKAIRNLRYLVEKEEESKT